MNTVRNAVAVIRYDWFGAGVGGPEASMRGQWLTLIVSTVLVFGCFFAIGRMRAGGGSQGEGSAALPAFSEHAAIPDALRGTSPAAGAVPSAIAAPPPPPPAPRVASARDVRAAEAARSFAAEASRTATPSTSTPVESAPAPEPVPTEAKAPAGSQGGSSSPSHGGSAGGGSTGTHASGGGGSFDSSE